MNASNDHQDFAIYPLMPNDKAEWLTLWRGYQAFYEMEIPDSTTDLTWGRFLDDLEPVWGAVARDASGRAVGLVHWVFHRSTGTAGNYCYLQDLFVSLAVRRNGAGRALITHVYDQAVQASCARVYWLTHDGNADARALYDTVARRTGFLQYRKDIV